MNRQKDMFSQVQTPTLAELVGEVEMALIPSSSLPLIPQSVARPLLGEPRNTSLSAVHATPTRKSAPRSQPLSSLLGIPPVNYGGYTPSSPLQPRCSTQLSAVPDTTVEPVSRDTTSRGIQETPIKKRAETIHGHPSAPTSRSDKENRGEKNVANVRTMRPSQEESIYTSLGWDDADDLDELS